jgi:hypothetical protein
MLSRPVDFAGSLAEQHEAFGRPGSSRGRTAFPQIRFVALVENGTHVLFGTQMARYDTGENTLAVNLPCGFPESNRPEGHEHYRIVHAVCRSSSRQASTTKQDATPTPSKRFTRNSTRSTRLRQQGAISAVEPSTVP